MKPVWYKHYEPGVPHSLKFPRQPLTRFLEDAAQAHPEHTALVYFNRRFSFRWLDTMANRFAHALAAIGFKPGERVAMMLPNCPQMIVAYYGILKARGILVQINPLLSPPEVGELVRDSGARILISLPRFQPVYGPLLAQGPLRHLILTDVGDFAVFPYNLLIPFVSFMHKETRGIPDGLDRHPFKKFLAGCPESNPLKKPNPSDIALIQYTSGTGGEFKGVMLSHQNLVSNVLQCRAWVYDLKPGPGGDVFLGVIPYFHVYGMTVGMNLALSAACTQVLLPRFTVAWVQNAARKYRCTIFPGVEIMYNALNHSPRSARTLGTIRACISGAGPLYRKVQEDFEALTHGRVVEGYGLTEASPVTHANPMFGDRKEGTVGLPFPGTYAKIMDAKTGKREVAPGRVGEMVIRGPQVMQGYWNKPKQTRHSLRNGWLYTGDLASVDKDGYFRVIERKKDMIKTRGENVYPRAVEEALLKFPGVSDVVVVGLPDLELDEKIKAYLVVKGTPPALKDLVAFCRKTLGKYEVPQEFEFRKSLPKNIIGKTLRRILREEEARKKEVGHELS